GKVRVARSALRAVFHEACAGVKYGIRPQVPAQQGVAPVPFSYFRISRDTPPGTVKCGNTATTRRVRSCQRLALGGGFVEALETYPAPFRASRSSRCISFTVSAYFGSPARFRVSFGSLAWS